MRKKKLVLEHLQVSGYAAGGKSIAKLEGKVVFIEGAVPGDVVDVRLSKNKKDWWKARRDRSMNRTRKTAFPQYGQPASATFQRKRDSFRVYPVRLLVQAACAGEELIENLKILNI